VGTKKFLGCIISGLDPRVPRRTRTPEAATELTVAQFLDRYWTTYVEAEGLRSARTIHGHLKALKASLGQQPVTVLEKPPEILRFKAEYRPGHEVATVNRVLGVLRSISGSASTVDDTVPSVRRHHQIKGGNKAGSAYRHSGGAGAVGCVLGHELR
jgi:hypothetical protein